jgi:WD40 repeat protein
LEGTDNSDVRIWDGKSLQLVAEFRGWQLGAAAFSPDGSKIAIGSVDKVIVGSVD